MAVVEILSENRTVSVLEVYILRHTQNYIGQERGIVQSEWGIFGGEVSRYKYYSTFDYQFLDGIARSGCMWLATNPYNLPYTCNLVTQISETRRPGAAVRCSRRM